MERISSFILNRLEELEKEDSGDYSDYLSQIENEVSEKYNTLCTYATCGGFNSTGYDITCHAIAFVDEDGYLDIMSFEEESY